MKRHEVWQAEYRADRYMAHLNKEELEQRAKDVFINVLVVTRENKISTNPLDEGGLLWMILWTHVLEEFALRYGPYPSGFQNGFIRDVALPRPDTELAKKVSTALSQVDLKETNSKRFLFKYGRLEHLIPARNEGIFRISPASYYDDPSLNPAIRDRELELYIQPPPSKLKLHVIDEKSGKIKSTLNPIGNKITLSTGADYHVFCMARALLPRLFLDFEVDACLLIKDMDLFTDAVYEAVRRETNAAAGMTASVGYIDPLHMHDVDKVDIHFHKHFRYAYQKEHRIVWFERNQQEKLLPLTIRLGDLSSMCEIIKINLI